MKDKIQILKVLVGSHAHGLADKDSDYDYRAVYVLPTSSILSIGFRYKGNDWIEGKEDNTAYEIGHFLQLATKSNPTILEVFRSPIIEANADGYELVRLFSYVWDPINAFNAFIGYAMNQRKKFMDKKDNRQDKYTVAYIRSLLNLRDLLQTQNFNIKVKESNKDFFLRYRKGNYTVGEVIDHGEELIDINKELLKECKHKADLDKVNNFLLSIRKKYWE